MRLVDQILTGLYYDFIYIHLDLFMDHVMKYGHHISHISRTNIFETERNYLVMIYTPQRNKNCIFCIFSIYQDLVITCVKIHKQLHFMLSTIINQNVNVWQRKIIFWAGFVEIFVIDTYSDFPIFLGNRNNIGQLNQVLCHFY